MKKGIDDFLSVQSNPVAALQELEDKATGLLYFIDADHRYEILRAIPLIKNPIEKELVLKSFAGKLGVSVKAIRDAINESPEGGHADTAGEFQAEEEKSGTSIVLDEQEVWPEPVQTGDLLDELIRVFKRFVILQDHAAETISLWVLFTWVFDVFMTCPILAVESPEKRCGKTTLLSLLAKIICRALAAANISPAAVFRAIEQWRPTLLIDEADSFLRENEDLRNILNSGHTRGTAFVIRTVGDDHEPRKFSTWGPKAIALIGKLPGTLEDRSIVVKMRRKRPDEKVERLRLDRMDAFEEIRRKCARWAADNIEVLKNADPEIPAGLHDRAADNWTPFLAIADLAGGEWPEKARQVALALSDSDGESDAAGTMLLRDIRDYLKETGTDRVFSSDLCSHLGKMEDLPWPEWSKGKAITTRQVAKLLKPFGIVPKSIRIGIETAKGYPKEVFLDAFSRYLPFQENLSVTPSQSNNDAGFRDFSSVTSKNDVTDKNNGKSSIQAGCDAVTDEIGGKGLPGENIPLFDEDITP